MEKFEEILTKYKPAKRTGKPKVTFEEVEKIIDFELPDDYKSFALNYSEFEDFTGAEYVRLWDFDEIVKMNTDYQIFDCLSHTLAIGGNGSSEYIAIEKLNDDRLRIVLSPFLIEEEAHIEIGVSFTDFLARLVNGKKWFD
jgi:hypothetical protein